MKSLLRINSLLFLIWLAIAGCGEHVQAENTTAIRSSTFEGRVTAVKDGDTFKVLYQGAEHTIRLTHIDCPEKKQAFGMQAKKFASDLCFGQTVIVKAERKNDRYGRMLAEIILPDGRNANKELVKNGMAWHFKRYSQDEDYARLEVYARTKRLGLWADRDAIAPWEWRKERRTRKKAERSLSASAY